jgi:glycerol uptake facilitator-like aquaporin
MSLGKRAVAEFFGTFWLVFGGCGAATPHSHPPLSKTWS